MKYDDASWHYGGDFPADLSPEAGATHIAMFVAWAVQSGLGGLLHVEEAPDLLQKLRLREISPGTWLIAACDEKFTSEDLNEEGNLFAQHYFGLPGEQGTTGACYLADYERTFPNQPSLYHVPDSWESFDKLKPTLNRRLAAWRNREAPFWRKWLK